MNVANDVESPHLVATTRMFVVGFGTKPGVEYMINIQPRDEGSKITFGPVYNTAGCRQHWRSVAEAWLPDSPEQLVIAINASYESNDLIGQGEIDFKPYGAGYQATFVAKEAVQ
jgi:hypothetical protein